MRFLLLMLISMSAMASSNFEQLTNGANLMKGRYQLISCEGRGHFQKEMEISFSEGSPERPYVIIGFHGVGDLDGSSYTINMMGTTVRELGTLGNCEESWTKINFNVHQENASLNYQSRRPEGNGCGFVEHDLIVKDNYLTALKSTSKGTSICRYKKVSNIETRKGTIIRHKKTEKIDFSCANKSCSEVTVKFLKRVGKGPWRVKRKFSKISYRDYYSAIGYAMNSYLKDSKATRDDYWRVKDATIDCVLYVAGYACVPLIPFAYTIDIVKAPGVLIGHAISSSVASRKLQKAYVIAKDIYKGKKVRPIHIRNRKKYKRMIFRFKHYLEGL